MQANYIYMVVMGLGSYDDYRETIIFGTDSHHHAMRAVDTLLERIRNYKEKTDNHRLEEVVEMFFSHWEDNAILTVRKVPTNIFTATDDLVHSQIILKPESYDWWMRREHGCIDDEEPLTEFEELVECIEERFDRG